MSINLGIVFSANDLASRVMGRLMGQFSNMNKMTDQMRAKFTKNAIGVVGGMGLMAAGAKTLAIPLSFTDSAESFEAAFVKMGARTGFAADEMDMLRQKALKLGVDTQFDPEEIAGAMQALGTMGKSAVQTFKMVDDVVDFSGASMGVMSMSEAAFTTSAAMQSFGRSADQTKMTVDSLTRSTQISSLDFKDLQRVIASGGKVSTQTGQSMETMLAAIGMIKDQGGKARGAANDYRMALEKLAGAARPTEKFLGRVGLKLTDLRNQKTGKFLELPDLFDKINNAVNKTTGKLSSAAESGVLLDKVLSRVFGKGGKKGFVSLMKSTVKITGSQYQELLKINPEYAKMGNAIMKSGRQIGVALKGMDALRAKTTILKNAQNAARVANEKYLATYSGLKDLLSGSLKTIKLVLGTPLLNLAKNGLKIVLNGFINPFLESMQKSPQAAAQLVKSIIMVGSALLAGGAVVTAVSAFSLLGVALSTVGLSIGGLAATVATSLLPLIPIMLLVGGAIAGAVYAWQTNFGGFRDFMKHTLSQTKIIWASFLKLFTGGSATDTDIFKYASPSTKTFIKNLIWAKATLKEFFTAIGEGFTSIGGPELVKELGSEVMIMGEAIAEAAGALLKFIPNAVGMGDALNNNKGEARSFGSLVGRVLAVAVFGAKLLVGGLTLALGAFTKVSNFVSSTFGKTLINAFLVILAVGNPFIGLPLLIAANWKTVGPTFLYLIEKLQILGDLIMTVGSMIVSAMTLDFSGAAATWDAFVLRTGERLNETERNANAAGIKVQQALADSGSGALESLGDINTLKMGLAGLGQDPSLSNIESIFNATAESGRKMSAGLSNTAQNALDTANNASAIKSAIGDGKASVDGFSTGLTSLVAKTGLTTADMGNKFQLMSTGMISDVTGASTSMTGEIAKVGPAGVNASQAVSTAFSVLPAQLGLLGKQSGNSFVNNMASTITSGTGRLGGAVNGMINKAIAANAKGHSPPPEGPMKDIDKWGIPIMKAYAVGIGKGAYAPQEAIQSAFAIPDSVRVQTKDGLESASRGNDFASRAKKIVPDAFFKDEPEAVEDDSQMGILQAMMTAVADMGKEIAGAVRADKQFNVLIDGDAIASSQQDRAEDDDRRRFLG